MIPDGDALHKKHISDYAKTVLSFCTPTDREWLEKTYHKLDLEQHPVDALEKAYVNAGTVGVLYRIGEQSVIKVTAKSALNETDVRRYEELQDQLLHPSFEFREHAKFFVHSEFKGRRLPAGPARNYYYEQMEYMDTDLLRYTQDYPFTYTQLIVYLCQIIHATRMMHSLNYIVTDMKLENIMINTKTQKVVFVDYMDSDEVASSKRSSKEKRTTPFMFTYRDRTRSNDMLDDSWRIGLITLQMLYHRVLQKKPIVDVIEDMYVRLQKREAYSYDTQLRTHTNTLRQLMRDYLSKDTHSKYDWPRDAIDKLFDEFLLNVLQTDLKKRLSVDAIANIPLFRDTCTKPRGPAEYAEIITTSSSRHVGGGTVRRRGRRRRRGRSSRRRFKKI